MDQMHNLLRRQLKKQFSALGRLPEELEDFIAMVNDAYFSFDSDRILLERSIEISSQELMQSLSLLNATLEATADGILVFDLNGRVVNYNRRFLDLWRIPDTLVVTRNEEEMFSYIREQQVDSKGFFAEVQQIYPHPEKQVCDLVRCKDGRVFEKFSQPQKIGERIVGCVWSFHDITERRRIEEELQQSEEYLKTIFNSVQAGVVIIDGETHRIVDINHAGARLFGAPKEQIVNVLCHNFICPAEKGKCPISDLHQEVDNSERVLVKANGERLPVLKTVVPITLKNRKFLLESFVDITERKKAEEALKDYTRQTERINQELDDFTYIVSHDLKEPLRSIDAFSKFIEEDYKDKLDEEGRNYIERIRANAHRMQDLIDDLLEISRIERKENIFEEFEVGEVINEAKLRLEYTIRQKNAEITVQGRLPKIFCDRVRLTEVFINLVSNAVKFCNKPDPRIEIGCKEEDVFYVFWVKDNGPGIEERYFDKIFEIFQRLDRREEYEGSGAGLTIAKKIIEMHKGKIWVESKAGEGATFYFTIPKRSRE